MTSKICRLPKVEEMTGRRRSAIYREIQEGRFPRPVKLGPRAVGWLEEEVQAWIMARIADRDREETAA